MNLGEVFPNFDLETTQGNFKFHDWHNKGLGWSILFSHPADYTPVCTTELGRVVKLVPEFKKRGIQLIALSCDGVDSHHGWEKDILSYAGQKSDAKFPYPIIADADRSIATQLKMIDPDEKDDKGMPLTCRAVFIVGADVKLKLALLYPATTGRNFDEILRVIDSLQLTATKKVATPVDWKPGSACMVVPSVKKEDEAKLFPKGVKYTEVPSGKGYLRFTTL